MTPDTTALAVCMFSVGPDLYGLPVADTAEVVRSPRVTPVPGADPAIAGLVNLRGGILVAVDARVRLGRPTTEAAPVAVVAVNGRSRVALLVDEVLDVTMVKPEDSRAVPAGLDATRRHLTKAVYQTSRGLLTILDAEQMWRWGQ